jgi:uncharacterized RDD family membrane protein YckC
MPPPPYAPYGAYPPPLPPPPKGWRLGLPPSGPGSLAEPARRLGARLLDGLFFLPIPLVVIAIALLVAAPHFGPLFPTDPPCPAGVPLEQCPVTDVFPGFLWAELTFFAASAASTVLYVLAEAAATARWSRTPGKAVMHLRVVRVSDRRPPGFWMALGRAGATAFAGMLQWIGLLDVLWCLWDENRQCVHDKIVGTVVVTD